ncbi:hypothetical protein FB45DRAFT_927720 [Roridomyces roridus]|uniref:Uncharacterized protein n=1 Tax=Roridomyces roridus TaxID=1738132 RepID=A0AAD7BIV8_9AGAR|nr:hypothetical protein FB45DRAFT_927720 [Roridomyces roridus]
MHSIIVWSSPWLRAARACAEWEWPDGQCSIRHDPWIISISHCPTASLGLHIVLDEADGGCGARIPVQKRGTITV